MISNELLKRYPFFASLNNDQLKSLADAGKVFEVEEGYRFFQEGDELDTLFLVEDGRIAIVMEVTDHSVIQPLSNQLTNNLINKEVTVSTLGNGEVFGWSALVPPHISTASAKSIRMSRIVAFDCTKLRPQFKKDCQFAYMMLLKASQVIRQRMRDMRMESLAFIPE
jgi:CRP/FNR family cyclic AMP-dependent transcriptional regulator